MPNIYDVAKAARVSVATVSAVVNDTAFVSPSLKTRVQAAIDRLGYQPNLLARSLAQQRSHTIGMIVPDIVNPFFPEVVRGAEDRARAAGYTLLLASSDNDPTKEELYLNVFLAKRVDGILLTKAPGRMPASLTARLRTARVPIVQIAREIPGVKADAVLMDDRGAAYEGVTHLLRLGYRRIGFITGIGHVSTTRRRLLGYRDALRDWQLEVDPRLVVEGDFQVTSGYTAGVDLLKATPDAVFISNYLMAVGFMRALRQYGLRCPDDVGIVTCDDHPWLDSFTPRLTTIDLPKHALGSEAARLLVERIETDAKRPAPRGRRPRFTVVQLRNAMCIRESCGAGLRPARDSGFGNGDSGASVRPPAPDPKS